MNRHDCPSCTCGKIELYWSDRSVWIDPEDPDAIVQAVMYCALDHCHDRGRGVPYGLSAELHALLYPVVVKHLRLAGGEPWENYTVEMDAEQRRVFSAELRRVVEDWLAK